MYAFHDFMNGLKLKILIQVVVVIVCLLTYTLEIIYNDHYDNRMRKYKSQLSWLCLYIVEVYNG